MAHWNGGFVGGLFAIYLLAAVWEWALIKRVMDDPAKGKVLSVIIAYLSAAMIAGFGMADGGPYAWKAFSVYIFPAAVLGMLAYRRGIALRSQQHQTGDEEVFS